MITFTSTKLSNQFFFISNLSEWHYSCRKHYNEEWLKNNPLSKEERRALKNIKPVLLKYNFGDKFIGKEFFQDSEQWKYVSQLVDEREYKILKNVFNVFQKRFDILWETEEKKIERWKNFLENFKEMNRGEIIRDIKIFLNSKSRPRIKAYLLVNPGDRGIGGGANEGKNKISLEISNKNLKYLPKVLSVLFHEVAHIYQRDYANLIVQKYIIKNNLKEKYQKIRPDLSKQEFNIRQLFSETIVGFLFNDFWEGTLTAKHFQHSKNIKFGNVDLTKKPRTIKEVLNLSVEMAGPKIKEYLENGKKINEELLEFIWQNFKKMNFIK